jgi:hemerythrin
MFFDWQPRFGLGVGEMDDAHKRLIHLMNQLHEQRAAGDGKAELRRTLKALADYTRQHFAEEEAFMASIAFPGLSQHQRIHHGLLTNLAEHVARFEAGSGAVDEELFSFLKLWLTGHIRGIDRSYAEHAHQQGRGTGPAA